LAPRRAQSSKSKKMITFISLNDEIRIFKGV